MKMKTQRLTSPVDIGVESTLYVVDLNTGQTALCARRLVDNDSLAVFAQLAASHGGRLETPMGVLHLEIARYTGVALLRLIQKRQMLASAAMAWLPHTPSLWDVTLEAYDEIRQQHGHRAVRRRHLKPETLPWMATVLMPPFMDQASGTEVMLVQVALWLLGLEILEQERKACQLN